MHSIFRQTTKIKSLHHISKRRIGIKGPPPPFHWFGGPSEIIQNIVLCSGQGSQYVGMFKELSREGKLTPEILNLFKMATSILGYDVIQLCCEGPKSKLDQTVFCQPIVVLANLVGAELLIKDKPWIYERNVHIAGYSLGEIPALHIAGSITAEEALIVTKSRAEAMQRACDISASAMFFVRGMPIDDLRQWCQELADAKKRPYFSSYAGIAIDCFPKACVVGATMDCEEDIMGLASDKITVTELPVSGAFHTPLMKPALEMFERALDKVDIRMPNYDLYSNVTGEQYTSVEEIRRLLLRQLVEPVQWQLIAKNIYKKPLICRTCELGAGHQLRAMLGKFDRRILKKYFNYKV